MQGLAQENLKNESKTHLNTKVRLASKSTIRHFWSADRHFQSAKLHSFGLWPNSLRVPIWHILFNLFVERRISIHILLIIAYILSIFYIFKFFLNFFESIVEIESCFLQLSISIVHKYCMK